MLNREMMEHNSKWFIHKYEDDAAVAVGSAYSVSCFEGNCLLNEGINNAEKLICGVTPDGSAYDNDNAYLGVGNGTATESAGQTALQGASKAYATMESGFPTVATQKMSWKSSFGSGDANFAWQEFTVVNASTDAGQNLNRKVSDQGTKTSGQTWVLTLEITLS